MEQTQLFPFDSASLQERAERLKNTYAQARPFPHIVLDQFFSEEVLESLLAEFPGPEDIQWLQLQHENSKKLASKNEEQLGPASRAFIHQLNSSAFIAFLEKLTGIEGLIPDPHLWGGGLHQILKGGFLNIHADFNKHTRLKLDRRINLLVYLNKDWKEEYGGHIQLWSRDMKQCIQKILPVFNRCVIFSTTDFSYHGHPEPLTCPEDRSRKSLALYYYSNGRPLQEISKAHSTLYRSPSKQNQPFFKKITSFFSSR